MRATRAPLLLGVSAIWVPLAFLFDGVTVLVLPLRVDASATDVGLVSLVGLGIAAGLQPIAGWFSDRYRGAIDRRVFLLAGAVPAIGGLWLLVGTTGTLAALLGYVVIQAGATIVQAAQQTLIPEHVDARARGRASGIKVAFDVGGAFLAFVVLGTLLVGGDLIAAAVATTVVMGIGVALLVLLVPSTGRVNDEPSRWSGLPPGLAALIASRFLFLFGTYAVGRFLLLLAGERLGLPADRVVDDAGWLLAVLTLATAMAALPMGWVADRASRGGLMVTGAALSAAGIVILAVPAGAAGLVAGGLLMAVGTAAFVTGNWAATTAIVPATQAGRLMAVANLGTGLAAAAAGLLGPLIDAAGFSPALLLAAAASAAAVVPLLTRTLRSNHPEGHAV